MVRICLHARIGRRIRTATGRATNTDDDCGHIADHGILPAFRHAGEIPPVCPQFGHQAAHNRARMAHRGVRLHPSLLTGVTTWPIRLARGARWHRDCADSTDNPVGSHQNPRFCRYGTVQRLARTRVARFRLGGRRWRPFLGRLPRSLSTGCFDRTNGCNGLGLDSGLLRAVPRHHPFRRHPSGIEIASQRPGLCLFPVLPDQSTCI